MSEVDPEAVDNAWDALVGARVDDGMGWWNHLGECRAVVAAVLGRTAEERAATLARWHARGGVSYADIAKEVGLTRARVQQLVQQGRRRCPGCGRQGMQQGKVQCTVCSASQAAGAS